MELLFVVDTTRLLVAAPLFLNKQSAASQPAFLDPPVAGADLRAALVASCLRGALPPVDLRAVCLVQAIVDVSDDHKRFGMLNHRPLVAPRLDLWHSHDSAQYAARN